MRITSETSINEIPHIHNRRNFRRIHRLEKNLCVFCWREVSNIFSACDQAISYWKIVLETPRIKEKTFGFISVLIYLFLFRLSIICSSCDHPWCTMVSHTITLFTVCLYIVTLDNAFQKVPKIKEGFFRINDLLQIWLSVSMFKSTV